MAINIKGLLEGVVLHNASDLHLKVGGPPMVRINGHLHPVQHPPLAPEDTEEANKLMMPDRCREQLDRDGTVDYSYGLSMTERFRVNCYHQRGAKSLAIRKIMSRRMSLEELNLPTQIIKLANMHRGLVLVTGITGCGKSSTLSALVHVINSTRREHIITIEDPIEFIYVDEKSIIDQVEVNQDVSDFKVALRHALRQDPDIILLGELRDRETLEVAMHCVETGHLVFSTLHTPDARQTITRISHFFTHEEQPLIFEQMSQNLMGVVCQRLLRTADGKGRVPCCEILFSTAIIQKLIAERRVEDIQQVLRSGVEGMHTFDMHLVQMVKTNTITVEEAIGVVEDEAAFRRLLKGHVAGGDRGSLLGG